MNSGDGVLAAKKNAKSTAANDRKANLDPGISELLLLMLFKIASSTHSRLSKHCDDALSNIAVFFLEREMSAVVVKNLSIR